MVTQQKKGWRDYLPSWMPGSVDKSASPFYSLNDPRLAESLRGFNFGTPKLLSLVSSLDYYAAWEKCPPLASILVRLANADGNGKVEFVKTDEEATPITKNYSRPASALRELMKRPNPLQTWGEFRAQQKIYKGLFGFCPVYMIKPSGIADPSSVKMMWNLPPHILRFHLTGKRLFQWDKAGMIEKIEVDTGSGGTYYITEMDDVMILRDRVPSLTTEVLPDSRLRALAYPVSNISAAYEAANVLITKRGALGILSPDAGTEKVEAIPFSPKQRKELQAEWQKHGLSHDQYQIVMAAAPVRWVPISLPIADLQLAPTIEQGTRAICDAYGYPYHLLSTERGTTFNNVEGFKKLLYQDTIIPEAESDMATYSEYFKTEESNYRVTMTYDHLEALQESEVQRSDVWAKDVATATALYQSGAITLNRMRELLEEPTTTDGETYYQQSTGTNGAAQDQTGTDPGANQGAES